MARFDGYYNKAIKQCNRVNKATEDCQQAKKYLYDISSIVEKNWQGRSGSAFVAAIDEVISELNILTNGLQPLEISMRSEASLVLTEWPNNPLLEGDTDV